MSPSSRCSVQHPETTFVFDLLWKFYEKNGNYRSAAKFLVRLAERHRSVPEKLSKLVPEKLSKLVPEKTVKVSSRKNCHIVVKIGSRDFYIVKIGCRLWIPHTYLVIFLTMTPRDYSNPDIMHHLIKLSHVFETSLKKVFLLCVHFVLLLNFERHLPVIVN